MKNTLLGKDELLMYDYVKLKNIITDIFKLFKYLKRTDDKISLPKITADYRVRYEQFVPVNNSVVENCVLRNMMLENYKRMILIKYMIFVVIITYIINIDLLM